MAPSWSNMNGAMSMWA